MIRVLRSTECPSCSGDYGYPCCCVMLTANLIADILPPDEARAFVRQLFFEQCSDILGSGDREELLDDFFARRARVRGDFLEGMGLRPEPEISGGFLPGSWFLHREWNGHCFTSSIRGVFALDGRMVSVPLPAAEFLTTAVTLRAVKRAVGAGGQVAVPSCQWRRIWNGFERHDVSGNRRWVVGLRYLLHQEFVAREGQFRGTN